MNSVNHDFEITNCSSQNIEITNSISRDLEITNFVSRDLEITNFVISITTQSSFYQNNKLKKFPKT